MIETRLAKSEYRIDHNELNKNRDVDFLNYMEKEQELRKDKTKERRNQDINNEEQKKNMKLSGHKGPGRAGGTELTLMLPNNSMLATRQTRSGGI